MAELLTRHKVAPPSAPNDGYRQIMEAFKTGQTAMVWHHTGSLTEIQAALKPEQFGTRADAGRPGGAHVARLTYLFNGVANPARIDADLAWITFWAEPEPGIAFLEETGYFPSSPKVAADERIVEEPALRGGGRDDEVRPPAADLRRLRRLVRDRRAAGVPEGAGRPRDA